MSSSMWARPGIAGATPFCVDSDVLDAIDDERHVSFQAPLTKPTASTIPLDNDTTTSATQLAFSPTRHIPDAGLKRDNVSRKKHRSEHNNEEPNKRLRQHMQ
jgi:hypothetical protein